MPYNCPACKKRVPEHCDCISCDNCYKWHHLACTDLTKTQFEVFTREKSFEWICNICVKKSCNKCNILTKQGTSIQCDKCENIYHLTCAGLAKLHTFQPLLGIAISVMKIYFLLIVYQLNKSAILHSTLYTLTSTLTIFALFITMITTITLNLAITVTSVLKKLIVLTLLSHVLHVNAWPTNHVLNSAKRF